MNIRIHSAEVNRIMKTISQCIDPHDVGNRANIRVTHEDNRLSFQAANGQFAAILSTPVMGGDGETFCVDGTIFAKVCGMCSGEIVIATDGRVFTVKGVGRTRLPVVEAAIPDVERVEGKKVTVNGGDFADCYAHVAYAVATDNSRVQLTGVLAESDGKKLKMVALDGFQMSVNETDCCGDEMKSIIPGAFMKLISQSVADDEQITLTADGSTVVAETEGMIVRCGLLAGEYPDYNRILPKEFKTKSRVKVDSLRDVLKAGIIVNSKQNLVKLDVKEENITVSNNSEQADFEAEVPCETQGDGLKIALNQKYLMNTIGAVDTDEAEMQFGTAITPVVVCDTDGKGIRLVLPVRVV